MRFLTTLVFLSVISLIHSAPAGNKKNHILEQEMQTVKDNLTDVWEVLDELRNQIEILENERNIRHHHHHYHHYYHSGFTEETNETELTDHDVSFELQLSQQVNITNSDDSGNTHHHYHHHIHHKHAKPEENTETNGNGLINHACNPNISNPHGNPHGTSQCNPHCKPNGNTHGKPNNKEDHSNIIAQAGCSLKPNRALPEKERQKIKGKVTFKQKGNILEIEIKIGGFEITDDGSQIPNNDAHVHGLHVHEFGDMSDGCESAGGHYNPLKESHGAPDSPKRHIGDLGNIECDEKGEVVTTLYDKVASLNGTYSIIGKTLVISENKDDFGTNGDHGSVTNGNSGRRLACCIITKEEIKTNKEV